MIYDIYYDSVSELYSVRDGRTGYVLVQPSPVEGAMAKLLTMGHPAAADEVREDHVRRASTALDADGLPSANMLTRWRDEADSLRANAEARRMGQTIDIGPVEVFEYDGKVLTGEEIERLAGEAEEGYNLDQLNPYPSELARLNPANTAPTAEGGRRAPTS